MKMTPNKTEALSTPALQVSHERQWFDNQDMMQMLYVSKSTLRRWRINGIIPFTQIGGKLWYHKTDVEAMMLKFRKKRRKQLKRPRQ